MCTSKNINIPDFYGNKFTINVIVESFPPKNNETVKHFVARNTTLEKKAVVHCTVDMVQAVDSIPLS